MAKRLTDTDMWDQDWFVELPNKYKLFWYYIKDKCDNVGIWRPNKTMAQKIIGEPLNLDDFLQFVNIDEYGEKKDRIIVLPSKKWFLKQFFVFQYGSVFSPTSHVHIGALRALVSNGIHPKEILNGSIGNLHYLDLEELKKIAYGKDTSRLVIAYGKDMGRTIDKAKDIDKAKE